MHLRVLSYERQDEPGENFARCCRERIDTQRARGRGLMSARNVHRRMDVPHRGSDLRDELLAGLRQGDASCCAVEQPDAECALQLSDRVTQCGG